MATVGNVIIGIVARTDRLERDLARASSDLTAFEGTALHAASSIDEFGEKAERTAKQVQTASTALGMFQGAAGAVVAATQAMGPALVVASAQVREFAVVTRSASIVAGTLAGAIQIVSGALRALASPFVAIGRMAAYVARNFGLLGLVFGIALAPIRPFIPLLRLFNIVAGATIGVVKGMGWAFGALRAVLTLNVRALAANVAKLGALAVAMAATAAVKVAAFSVNVLKSTLANLAKVAVPAALALAFVAKSAAGAVDDAGDTADRIGTTTANLMAMQYAAKLTGSNVESLRGALAKMVPNLGDAATKGGPVADALKAVGLSAQDLARMDAVDAFGLIADRLSKVENPAQRAALAMDIFGKGGVAILGTINAGGTEIQRLTGEFRKMGTVSEAQRQSIGKMFDAFDRIGAVVSAIGAAVAAELSPYVSAAADYFVKLATAGGGAGSAVAAGVDLMTAGIAKALDVVGLLNHGFLIAQRFATQAFAAIAEGAALVSSYIDVLRTPIAAVGSAIAAVGDIAWTVGSAIGGAFGDVARAVGSVASWLVGKALQLVEVFGRLYTAIAGETQKSDLTKTLESVKRGLDETAAAQADGIARFTSQATLGDKARAVFADIKSGAADAARAVDPATAAMKRMGDATFEVAGKIGDLVDKLKEERDTFGAGSTAVELFKLRKEGATEATLRQAEAIADEIDKMRQASENDNRMVDQAAAIVDATRTPIETLRAELDKINKLKAEGYLTDSQAKRGADKATEAFRSTQANPRSAALELGSQQARSAILAFRDRGRSPDDTPQKATAQNTSKAVEIQTASLSVLQTIARTLSGAPATAEVF